MPRQSHHHRRLKNHQTSPILRWACTTRYMHERTPEKYIHPDLFVLIFSFYSVAEDNFRKYVTLTERFGLPLAQKRPFLRSDFMLPFAKGQSTIDVN